MLPLRVFLNFVAAFPFNGLKEIFQVFFYKLPVLGIKDDLAGLENSGMTHMHGLALLLEISNDLFLYFVEVVVFFFCWMPVFIGVVRNHFNKNEIGILRLVF